MPAIESNLSSGFAHDMTAVFGRVYRVNGWDPMSVWDGQASSAYPAGIGPPPTYSTNVTSAAAGADLGMTPGVHFFRYRYADSKTQYPSNPSEEVQFQATAGGSGTGASYVFSNIVPSPDPKVDLIVCEMTQADGTEYYQAGVLPNESGTFTYASNDTQLLALPLLYDDNGHDVPPVFRYVEAFKGRMWGLGQQVYDQGAAAIVGAGLSVAGSGTQWRSAAKGRLITLSGDTSRFVASVVSSTLLLLEESATTLSQRAYTIVSPNPDVLFYSKPLYCESFPAENQIPVLDGKPEKARALRGYRNDLIIWGERSMQRLVYSSDIATEGSLEPVEGDRGAASRLCVVDAGGAVFALDYKGLHRYVGGEGEPEHMSEAIDPLFDPTDDQYGYVDFSYRSTFHAVHYPIRHQIAWFVVLNGSGDGSYTTPHHAIVYDYKNNSFGLWRFDVGMVASTIAPDGLGRTQTLVCDENGRAWVLGIGTTDGAHPSGPVSATVLSATATQVRVSATAALYTAGSGMNGSYAYSPDLGAGAVITSNNASNFALAGSGFVSVPASGSTVHFGRIPCRIKTKAFMLREPEDVNAPRYLHISYEPKTLGSLRVRTYLNRATTPYAGWAEAAQADSAITLASGTDFYAVDMTAQPGYFRIPLPSSVDDGSNAGPVYTVEVEVETVGAYPVEINSIAVDGYAEEWDQEP